MSDKQEMVYVKWLDHFRWGNEWLEEEEITESLLECETMGFLVKENSDSVCIAETRRNREKNPVYSGVMVIAKVLITERKEIKI